MVQKINLSQQQVTNAIFTQNQFSIIITTQSGAVYKWDYRNCSQGFYQTQELECLSCYPCNNCQKDNNSCQDCLGEHKSLANNCHCLPGYYDDGHTCVHEKQLKQGDICREECQFCLDSQTCIVCKDKNKILPLCIQYKNNLYPIVNQSGDIIYKQCDSVCKTCQISDKNCIECNGKNRIPGISGGCQCLVGYHDNNKSQLSCSKCPDLCKTCENYNECTSCLTPDMILDLITKKCDCEQGHKLNLQKSHCVRCHKYLFNCVEECPSHTKLDGETDECIIQPLIIVEPLIDQLINTFVFILVCMSPVYCCYCIYISRRIYIIRRQIKEQQRQQELQSDIESTHSEQSNNNVSNQNTLLEQTDDQVNNNTESLQKQQLQNIHTQEEVNLNAPTSDSLMVQDDKQ